MTVTELSNVAHAFGQLDADTAAAAVAVFGREPEVDLEPAEADRLAAIIAAVTTGQQAAANLKAAGVAAAPMTPAEAAAPTLEGVPPDVEPLRARIRNMDEAARDVLLQRWTAAGLPSLADAEGNGVLIDPGAFLLLEQLVADHEPPAGEGVHAWLIDRWQALGPGAHHVAEQRYKMQSARDLRNALELTEGRAGVLDAILHAAEAEQEDTVTAALGPVADPVGEVITAPVADAGELADALPPKAKVAEVLAWVGADLTRARFALNAEQARSKPRDGVLSKLAPLVGGAAEAIPPASAPPIATPADGPSADVAPAEEVEAPVPPAAAPPTSSAPLAEGVELTIDDALASYADVTAWGSLTIVAYLRRLASNLEDAARRIEEASKP